MAKDEREARLKSGALRVGNRVGWAMSHLTKAGFIEKVGKATYKATAAGKEFLKKHAGHEVTYHDLKAVEGYEEAWQSASQANQSTKQSKPTPSGETSDSTPEESIDQAVGEMELNLRAELLEQLLSIDPYRFEQVVIDLLFAMGYGGSREEAAQVTKKSGDEGIDGIINEDRLGLDVIYVQAKRWKADVGREQIQNFVGALVGKHATKGVFITTSDFHKTATEYARSVQHKVILIGGKRLAELMIEYNVGVSTVRTIALKRVDSDYFEE
jgi:restriction system protein